MLFEGDDELLDSAVSGWIADKRLMGIGSLQQT